MSILKVFIDDFCCLARVDREAGTGNDKPVAFSSCVQVLGDCTYIVVPFLDDEENSIFALNNTVDGAKVIRLSDILRELLETHREFITAEKNLTEAMNRFRHKRNEFAIFEFAEESVERRDQAKDALDEAETCGKECRKKLKEVRATFWKSIQCAAEYFTSLIHVCLQKSASVRWIEELAVYIPRYADSLESHESLSGVLQRILQLIKTNLHFQRANLCFDVDCNSSLMGKSKGPVCITLWKDRFVFWDARNQFCTDCDAGTKLLGNTNKKLPGDDKRCAQILSKWEISSSAYLVSVSEIEVVDDDSLKIDEIVIANSPWKSTSVNVNCIGSLWQVVDRGWITSESANFVHASSNMKVLDRAECIKLAIPSADKDCDPDTQVSQQACIWVGNEEKGREFGGSAGVLYTTPFRIDPKQRPFEICLYIERRSFFSESEVIDSQLSIGQISAERLKVALKRRRCPSVTEIPVPGMAEILRVVHEKFQRFEHLEEINRSVNSTRFQEALSQGFGKEDKYWKFLHSLLGDASAKVDFDFPTGQTANLTVPLDPFDNDSEYLFQVEEDIDGGYLIQVFAGERPECVALCPDERESAAFNSNGLLNGGCSEGVWLELVAGHKYLLTLSDEHRHEIELRKSIRKLLADGIIVYGETQTTE